MSLRHLYRDLNSLGVYPDLIDGKKSGEVCISIDDYIICNKYYGQIITLDIRVCEDDILTITFNHEVKVGIKCSYEHVNIISFGQEYWLRIRNGKLYYDDDIPLGELQPHNITCMCSDILDDLYEMKYKDEDDVLKIVLKHLVK